MALADSGFWIASIPGTQLFSPQGTKTSANPNLILTQPLKSKSVSNLSDNLVHVLHSVRGQCLRLKERPDSQPGNGRSWLAFRGRNGPLLDLLIFAFPAKTINPRVWMVFEVNVTWTPGIDKNKTKYFHIFFVHKQTNKLQSSYDLRNSHREILRYSAWPQHVSGAWLDSLSKYTQ